MKQFAKNRINKSLSKAIAESGISKGRISKACGLTRSQLSAMIHGKYKVIVAGYSDRCKKRYSDTAIRMCNFLGIDCEDVFPHNSIKKEKRNLEKECSQLSREDVYDIYKEIEGKSEYEYLISIVKTNSVSQTTTDRIINAMNMLMYGYEVPEIAKTQGITRSAVYNYLHKVKRLVAMDVVSARNKLVMKKMMLAQKQHSLLTARTRM